MINKTSRRPAIPKGAENRLRDFSFFPSPEITDGAVRAKLSLLKLCRVATEVDIQSKGIQGEVEPL